MPRMTKQLVVALTAYTLAGCTPGFEGEYGDPAKAEIIDDKWNETDARKTSEHMVKGMLEKPWLTTFTQSHNGKKPTVIVDDIENRTSEHLDTKQLGGAIQDDLINSQKVSFVDKERREKLLEELRYQQSGNASASTAKKSGKQIGADYLLSGFITSKESVQDELKTVSYWTNLTLTNIETFELEWSTKYEIKKRFRRSGAGW